MAETYLNLLNSAAEVSAKVYEQIDQSMTNRLNVEAQAGKFQVDAMQKAAQFAETQRMNDEQIMNMRAGNYMQAQKLEVEKMLMPIKMETENLRLESQRLALQRQKEQEGKNHFNSLTSIYDDQIGHALLQTESEAMAQEYLGYKARVSDFVAKGGKFDSISFEKSLMDIRSKYKDVKPTSVQQVEYNPQTSYLLGQISPKLQAEYDKRHPLVQGSRNSVANNFYNADEKGLNTLLNSGAMGKLYNPEEVGLLWSGRSAVQQNYLNIEKWNRDLSRERNDKADAQAKGASPEELSNYDKNIAQYSNDIRAAMDQNLKIFKDSSLGKYGIQAPEITPVDKKPGGSTFDISGYSNKETTMGIQSRTYPDMDSTGQQMKSGVDATAAAITGFRKDEKTGNIVPNKSIQETELSEVDLSWWDRSGSGDEPSMDAKESIRERVEIGVDRVKGLDGNIGDVVTRDKVEGLLKTIDKDVAIPISNVLSDILKDSKSGIVSDESGIAKSEKGSLIYDSGIEEPGRNTIWFGPKREGISKIRGAGIVSNADDIFAAINKMPSKTRADKISKDEAIKELYSALTAASISAGLTNKDK